MASNLQLLGTGSGDFYIPPCILLFFDQQRYLFGAGEGTQRCATEYHVKLSKIRHVFCTRIQPEQVGGLTGLLITLADLGIKRVGVHGPQAVQHFLQASRNVSIRSSMAIDCYEPNAPPVQAGSSPTNAPQPSAITNPSSSVSYAMPFSHFTDANISVEMIVIASRGSCVPPLKSFWQQQVAHNHGHAGANGAATTTAHVNPDKPLARAASPAPAQTAGAEEPFDGSIDDTPRPTTATDSAIVADPSESSTSSEPAAKKQKHRHTPAAQSAEATHAAPSASAQPHRDSNRFESEWSTAVRPALVAYLVQLATTAGKFDLSRAKALGIPPGPLYAKLKAGETVKVRKSEMIVPGQPKKQQKQPMKQKQQQQGKKGAGAPAAASATAPAAPADTPMEDAATAAVADADDELLTFHPSDCVAAPTPGPIFAVVDCPNRAFIKNVVEHRAFAPYQIASSGAASSSSASSSPALRLSVILHLSPLSVLSDPSYTAWMSSFGSTTHHLLLNRETSVCKPVFKSAALNYCKMQEYINAEVFPARMPTQTTEEEPESNSTKVAKVLASFPPALQPQLVPGATLLHYHLLSGRKDLPPVDSSPAVRAILPADVEASLIEGSNPEGRERLRRWKEAMKEGREQGKGVPEIAEALKVEWLAQAEAAAKLKSEEQKDDTKMEDAPAAAASSERAPSPSTPADLILSAPTPLPAFTPSPSILSHLSSQPCSLSPQILFLGTGSAIPSKYRNVTGQILHTGYVRAPVCGEGETEAPMVGAMVLDCGEGSYGQLCLRYAGVNGGTPEASTRYVNNLIADLKAVWISHIHADHHLGLLTFLTVYKQTWLQRYNARHGEKADHRNIRLVSPENYNPDPSLHHIPKLTVIGPKRLFYWLRDYSACALQVGEEDQIDEQPGKDDGNKMDTDSSNAGTPSRSSLLFLHNLFSWLDFLHCSDVQDRENFLAPFFATELPHLKERYPDVETRKVEVWHTVQVKHCVDAYGLVLETSAAKTPDCVELPPWKLVVSGDTQPCQALVDAGVDATLLVHEATLEDDMIQEARDKRHSTTKQAIEVGLKMNASRILLTHFSQRYPKIPTFSEHFSSRTALAFDLMCVRFNQLAWLPVLTQSYGWLFDEAKLKQNDGKDDQEM